MSQVDWSGYINDDPMDASGRDESSGVTINTARTTTSTDLLLPKAPASKGALPSCVESAMVRNADDLASGGSLMLLSEYVRNHRWEWRISPRICEDGAQDTLGERTCSRAGGDFGRTAGACAVLLQSLARERGNAGWSLVHLDSNVDTSKNPDCRIDGDSIIGSLFMICPVAVHQFDPASLPPILPQYHSLFSSKIAHDSDPISESSSGLSTERKFRRSILEGPDNVFSPMGAEETTSVAADSKLPGLGVAITKGAWKWPPQSSWRMPPIPMLGRPATATALLQYRVLVVKQHPQERYVKGKDSPPVNSCHRDIEIPNVMTRRGTAIRYRMKMEDVNPWNLTHRFENSSFGSDFKILIGLWMDPQFGYVRQETMDLLAKNVSHAESNIGHASDDGTLSNGHEGMGYDSIPGYVSTGRFFRQLIGGITVADKHSLCVRHGFLYSYKALTATPGTTLKSHPRDHRHGNIFHRHVRQFYKNGDQKKTYLHSSRAFRLQNRSSGTIPLVDVVALVRYGLHRVVNLRFFAHSSTSVSSASSDTNISYGEDGESGESASSLSIGGFKETGISREENLPSLSSKSSVGVPVSERDVFTMQSNLRLYTLTVAKFAREFAHAEIKQHRRCHGEGQHNQDRVQLTRLWTIMAEVAKKRRLFGLGGIDSGADVLTGMMEGEIDDNDHWFLRLLCNGTFMVVHMPSARKWLTLSMPKPQKKAHDHTQSQRCIPIDTFTLSLPVIDARVGSETLGQQQDYGRVQSIGSGCGASMSAMSLRESSALQTLKRCHGQAFSIALFEALRRQVDAYPSIDGTHDGGNKRMHVLVSKLDIEWAFGASSGTDGEVSDDRTLQETRTNNGGMTESFVDLNISRYARLYYRVHPQDMAQRDREWTTVFSRLLAPIARNSVLNPMLNHGSYDLIVPAASSYYVFIGSNGELDVPSGAERNLEALQSDEASDVNLTPRVDLLWSDYGPRNIMEAESDSFIRWGGHSRRRRLLGHIIPILSQYSYDRVPGFHFVKTALKGERYSQGGSCGGGPAQVGVDKIRSLRSFLRRQGIENDEVLPPLFVRFKCSLTVGQDVHSDAQKSEKVMKSIYSNTLEPNGRGGGNAVASKSFTAKLKTDSGGIASTLAKLGRLSRLRRTEEDVPCIQSTLTAALTTFPNIMFEPAATAEMRNSDGTRVVETLSCILSPRRRGRGSDNAMAVPILKSLHSSDKSDMKNIKVDDAASAFDVVVHRPDLMLSFNRASQYWVAKPIESDNYPLSSSHSSFPIESLQYNGSTFGGSLLNLSVETERADMSHPESEIDGFRKSGFNAMPIDTSKCDEDDPRCDNNGILTRVEANNPSLGFLRNHREPLPPYHRRFLDWLDRATREMQASHVLKGISSASSGTRLTRRVLKEVEQELHFISPLQKAAFTVELNFPATPLVLDELGDDVRSHFDLKMGNRRVDGIATNLELPSVIHKRLDQELRIGTFLNLILVDDTYILVEPCASDASSVSEDADCSNEQHSGESIVEIDDGESTALDAENDFRVDYHPHPNAGASQGLDEDVDRNRVLKFSGSNIDSKVWSRLLSKKEVDAKYRVPYWVLIKFQQTSGNMKVAGVGGHSKEIAANDSSDGGDDKSRRNFNNVDGRSSIGDTGSGGHGTSLGSEWYFDREDWFKESAVPCFSYCLTVQVYVPPHCPDNIVGFADNKLFYGASREKESATKPAPFKLYQQQRQALADGTKKVILNITNGLKAAAHRVGQRLLLHELEETALASPLILEDNLINYDDNDSTGGDFGETMCRTGGENGTTTKSSVGLHANTLGHSPTATSSILSRRSANIYFSVGQFSCPVQFRRRFGLLPRLTASEALTMLGRTKELINFGLKNRRNAFVYFAPPSTRKYRTYYFQLKEIVSRVQGLDIGEVRQHQHQKKSASALLEGEDGSMTNANIVSINGGSFHYGLQQIELVVWGLERVTANITQELCDSIEQREFKALLHYLPA
jgi:hypothetical protein